MKFVMFDRVSIGMVGKQNGVRKIRDKAAKSEVCIYIKA